MLSATRLDEHTESECHHLVGIRSLPHELLREIFEHAAALCTEKLDINHSLLPALLQTCTLWRENVFATPRIWSFVYFAYKIVRGADGQDALYCTLDSVPTYLRYSQLHYYELHVEIYAERRTKASLSQRSRDPLKRALDTLAQHLLPHAHRCVSLTSIEEGPRHFPIFVPPSGMNNLRRLKLQTRSHRGAAELFPPHLFVENFRDGRCDAPLFMQRDYTLDNLCALDLCILNCLSSTALEGFTVVTFRCASELRGLRCLKVNTELWSAYAYLDAQTVELHSLEVLVLMGHSPHFSTEVHIVAPNLLYLDYTPYHSLQSERPWHFPKLIELETRLALLTPASAYLGLVENHLSSLRVLIVHTATVGLIARAAHSAAAPALSVLRVVVSEIDEALWEALLQVLEKRQEVRLESDLASRDQVISRVPAIYRARCEAIAERWAEARLLSIFDRFFEF